MARKNRAEIIDESQVGIYHCTSRCVRQAFLCGFDVVRQFDRGHRRRWLRQRLVWLAERFSIEVISYSILGNHLHLVLRNRPDLVESLSDEQVIRAWWRISPSYRLADGSPGKISQRRLTKLLEDAAYIAERRRRLSSISWWMRYLTQPLAVSANTEDQVSGRFWEGRFFSKPVTCLEQLLSTMIYVDLNPIRAGLALTPETSDYSSVCDRIASRQAQRSGEPPSHELARRKMAHEAELETLHRLADDWLSPIELVEARQDPQDADRFPQSAGEATVSDRRGLVDFPAAARASDLGVLPISAEKYLQLVDWMGRMARGGRRGAIPAELPPILERLGLGTDQQWLATYQTHAAAMDQFYRRPVNLDAEVALSGLRLANPQKSLRDALR